MAGVLAVVIAACGGGGAGGLEVTDVRIGQPTGPNAALYLTATNEGDVTDRLLGASTDAADAVELHETTMGDDGTMGMQPVDGIDLPVGDTLILEPGGYHLMLIGADRMEVGDAVDVTLTWEEAGDMTVEAEVVAASDTMGDTGHDDMDMGDEGDG